jgi:hypothetical protein
MSILPQRISIRNHQHVHGNTILFEVFVQVRDDVSWTIFRRFSAFVALRTFLLTLKLGSLPPLTKTWLPTSIPKNPDAAFVQHRKQELDAFLQAVLEVQGFCTHPEFLRFIDIVEHYNENTPVEALHILERELMDPTYCFFGLNRIIVDYDNLFMISTGFEVKDKEYKEGSRSKFSIPETAQVAPGCLSLWNFNEHTRDWEVIARDKFSCPIHDIVKINPTRYLIAMEDGYLLLVGLNEAFNRMEKLSQLKGHTSTITGVCYNKQRDFFLTTSLDGKLGFGTLDMRTSIMESKGSLQPDVNSPLTCLVHVPERQLVFVGTHAQTVLVYTAPSIPPACVQVLRLNISSPIHTLYWHTRTEVLLIGDDDGAVSAHVQFGGSQCTPVKAKRAHEIGDIPNKRFRLDSKVKATFPCPGVSAPVTVILFVEENQELIVGYMDGSLCVFGAGARPKSELMPHRNAISQLVWIHKRRTLVSASLDGRVKIWRWPSQARPSISELFGPAPSRSSLSTALPLCREGSKLNLQLEAARLEKLEIGNPAKERERSPSGNPPPPIGNMPIPPPPTTPRIRNHINDLPPPYLSANTNSSSNPSSNNASRSNSRPSTPPKQSVILSRPSTPSKFAESSEEPATQNYHNFRERSGGSVSSNTNRSNSINSDPRSRAGSTA